MVRYIIIGIVAVVLLLTGSLWLMRRPILENYLSKQLNAQVKISEVMIGYKSIILQDIEITNPKKTSIPNILTISKIEIDFQFIDFLKRDFRIKRLQIFRPKFFLEIYNESGSENNWVIFLNKMTNSSKSKIFIIESIYLYAIEFEAYDLKQSIDIWPIPFMDIENPNVHQSLSEMIRALFNTITKKMISSSSLPSLLKREITPFQDPPNLSFGFLVLLPRFIISLKSHDCDK